jgi:SAM-dependent methyltransferase
MIIGKRAWHMVAAISDTTPTVGRLQSVTIDRSVHEILRVLPTSGVVLDLGCGRGSFQQADAPAMVVRCDLDISVATTLQRFVCASADILPFKECTFDAVILNHSLEHFANPEKVLSELGRICRKSAFLYIAVPDASSLTDRIYRWIGKGGGHVNHFSDVDALVRMVSKATGMPSVGGRPLFTSLSFLNSRNIHGRKPRRLYLVGGGSERILRVITFLLRKIDIRLGTRLSSYGWALYFGRTIQFHSEAWSNVCIRCGAGHSSKSLTSLIRSRVFRIRYYVCPSCGAPNLLTDDEAFSWNQQDHASLI